MIFGLQLLLTMPGEAKTLRRAEKKRDELSDAELEGVSGKWGSCGGYTKQICDDHN